MKERELGIVKKIAERWLHSWSIKRGFTKAEEALVLEFAVFVDSLMEGEDEESLG